MEEFLEKLAEALDEETPICADTVLFELETWDSLGALAVAAMAKAPPAKSGPSGPCRPEEGGRAFS